MLESILDLTEGTANLSDALICAAAALAMGFIIALTYSFKNSVATKSMSVSLVILPVLVQTVIMMVNGNLGAGVAVLGAFSLVRFRSVPGSARDICSIFTAMAAGLGCGMGYVVFSSLVAVAVCTVLVILTVTPFGEKRTEYRELRIVVPETLDYMGAFEDVFGEYTKSCELTQVKTTNLGSMFDLRYKVRLRNVSEQKAFLDAVRCRNGNLTVSLGHYGRDAEEL